MRWTVLRPAVVLLFLAVVVTPGARADVYRIQAVDASGAEGDFLRGETVFFKVSAWTNVPRSIDHRIYVYDAANSFLGVVDDGLRTQTTQLGESAFRVSWDQRIGGVALPAGLYRAEYRGPEGSVVSTPFEIEYAPDFVVTTLRVVRAELLPGGLSPQMSVYGCVLNEGVQPAASVPVTLSSKSALANVWSPQLTFQVTLGKDDCASGTARGKSFDLMFNALAAPGGLALREVRAEANAQRVMQEFDVADNARSAPATWLL